MPHISPYVKFVRCYIQFQAAQAKRSAFLISLGLIPETPVGHLSRQIKKSRN